MARLALLVAAACAAARAAIMAVDLGSESAKVGVASPGRAFEISINVESKRKTPAALAFYQGERLLGGHADALRGRKPANVVQEPFSALGKGPTHPFILAAAADPASVVTFSANARGGVDYNLPVGSVNSSSADPVVISAEEATAMYL
jgi:molecular chaperone DnaK (HSP70)